jgi:hypothetical protein
MAIGGIQRSAGGEASATPAREPLTPTTLAWLAVVPVAVVGVVLGWVLGPPLGRHLFAVNPHAYTFLPSPNFEGPLTPDPTQHARFVIALVVPAMFALGLLRLRAGRWRLPTRLVTVWVVAAQLAGVAFAALSGYEQRHVWLMWAPGRTYFPSWGLPAAVAFALLVVLWAGRGSIPDRLTHHPGRRWDIVLGAAAIILALLWLLPYIYRGQNLSAANGAVQYNLMFSGDDILSVSDGRSPLVNYVGQYTQLLPYGLAPVLGLLNYTIGALTTGFTLLAVAGFACIYRVFRRLTRDPRIALALYVPFLAISVDPQTIVGDQRLSVAADFSIYSIRYLGPFVLAWLLARHLDGAAPRRRFWLFAVGGLVMINNVDFGVPALGATFVALWIARGPEGLLRRLLELIRDLALGVLAAAAAVCVLTLVRAGTLPDFGYAIYFARLFALIGVGQLPMPELGFHLVVYMTFVAALLTAVVRARRADSDATLTGMLAFSAIFGLGAASYYANRSHPDVLMALFSAWGFSVSLLAWVALRALWLGARQAELHQRVRGALPVLAALVCLGLTASTISGFPPPWSQVSRIQSNTGVIADVVPGAVPFLKAHTRPGDHVLLLMGLGHNIAREAGIVNVMPFNNPITMVLAQQVRLALHFLRASHGDQIFAVTSPTSDGYNAFNVLGQPTIAMIRHAGYVPALTDPVTQLTEWLPRGVSPTAR